MEVIIQPSPGDCAATGARIIGQLLKGKTEAVLGLATGSTPLPLYRELITMNQRGELDFSTVTSFNLDEYIGLQGDHPCSYRYFMEQELFKDINIEAERTHVPDGLAVDVSDHCRAYEQAIRDCGGIDLQILGLGTDGHIGFNEPGSSLGSRTRIKTLTGKTCEDNARFFESIEEVPRHCITMGVATIMECRQILLFAFGEAKAEIIAKAIEGPVSAMVPASVLQMHPEVKILIDDAAASCLEHADYYKEVFAGKPSWQCF
ncbi:MAG: glucosamine-6-phosphate deaminase [Verrucomicrobiaceae bacterium]|nr:glucosamine-6-phosphate deaminase [Verrucomicrobiaceae bacterium]